MELLWIFYLGIRIIALVGGFYFREQMIEAGELDPEAEPHKFRINLEVHDQYMFIWIVLLELIMYVYILRKA